MHRLFMQFLRLIALQTDLYPRPSHADWTYLEKYGVKASSGGGRSSARETIGTYRAFPPP